jgi:rubrerythrin
MNNKDTSSKIRCDNREELIFLLSEAAELEHSLLCSYLFTAFSLKSEPEEGLSEQECIAVRGWKKTISGVAAQEMLHLALVSNLLTAIGAAPHFSRPNFPQRSKYYPASIRLALTPFNFQTLQHFIYIERPQGTTLEDAPAFSEPEPNAKGQVAQSQATTVVASDEVTPLAQDFVTLEELYRGIEAGFRHLSQKYGEQRLFSGPSHSQATSALFSFTGLQGVTDTTSALRAIELIIEQGEGSPKHRTDSHYAQYKAIQEEYQQLKAQRAEFEPTRPVLENPFGVIPVDTFEKINLLDDPYTVDISNVFNGVYEVMLQMLVRFFAHTQETDNELKTLIDSAINMMFELIKPLGELLTKLPAGPSYPGLTAGPSFQFYRTVHLLPHKRAAWLFFEERLEEIAEYVQELLQQANEVAAVAGKTTAVMEATTITLVQVEASLHKLAGVLKTQVNF